jgi:hypothetical protein
LYKIVSDILVLVNKESRKYMPIIYECDVPDLNSLFVRDPEPRIDNWQGRKALRLSGQGACLLVIPDLILSQGRIEADISSESVAYPGIAFRIHDSLNYELAYTQPHTSGKWDALQYDPVFHGSNTWQLYHGSGAQQIVDVPPRTWFRLRIEFEDQRAVIQVGRQEPLVVSQLAHAHRAGLMGLWTYLPAYFSNFRISDDPPNLPLGSHVTSLEKPALGTVTEWFLEDFGKVTIEPSGILNLNRYLPISVEEVRLVRDLELLEDGNLTFRVGFSDDLTLQVDEEVIFQGENLYHDTPNWEERGYVWLNKQVSHHLNKGIHQLTAILKAKEYFGFGLALAIEGDEYKLLPAHLHN